MSGIEQIAAERLRQTQKLGWSPDHDDEHDGDLAAAAVCYASVPYRHQRFSKARNTTPPAGWPWSDDDWKPGKQQDDGIIPTRERIRELVKAGALIAAEIDRLERLAAKEEASKKWRVSTCSWASSPAPSCARVGALRSHGRASGAPSRRRTSATTWCAPVRRATPACARTMPSRPAPIATLVLIILCLAR